jgi:hypothetical protein
MIKQIVAGSTCDYALLTNGMIEILPFNGAVHTEIITFDVEEIAYNQYVNTLLCRMSNGQVISHRTDPNNPVSRLSDNYPKFFSRHYKKIISGYSHLFGLTVDGKIHAPVSAQIHIARQRNREYTDLTQDIKVIEDMCIYRVDNTWRAPKDRPVCGFVSLKHAIHVDGHTFRGINKVITCTDTHKCTIHKKVEATHHQYDVIVPGEVVKKVLIHNLAWILCESGNLYKCPDQKTMAGTSQDIVKPHKLKNRYEDIHKGRLCVYRIRDGLIDHVSRSVAVPDYLKHQQMSVED